MNSVQIHESHHPFSFLDLQPWMARLIGSVDKTPKYGMDQLLHIRQWCMISIQWSLPIKNSCILCNDSCILCSDPCIVCSNSCILRSWKYFSWISWFSQQNFDKILSDYYFSKVAWILGSFRFLKIPIFGDWQFLTIQWSLPTMHSSLYTMQWSLHIIQWSLLNR